MEKEKETLDENIKDDVAKDVSNEEILDEINADTDVDSETEENVDELENADESETECEDSEESDTDDLEDADDSDKKKKKKFSKKKDKKDQQIEELNDKYQRLFAEFQNFRSRSEKEKSAMFEVGAKSIIEKILPVVDNFERGVAALSEEDLDSPVGQGMNLIYKQITTALEDMGVTVIETEGKEFDPELHNAVMHEDNDELGENIISQEFQKGYKYRDTVIRHSMVKVAN